MMKVIATDTYGREIPDRVIYPMLEPIDAKRIVDVMNLIKPEGEEWYYRAVEDDYKLWDVV